MTEGLTFFEFDFLLVLFFVFLGGWMAGSRVVPIAFLIEDLTVGMFIGDKFSVEKFGRFIHKVLPLNFLYLDLVDVGVVRK